MCPMKDDHAGLNAGIDPVLGKNISALLNELAVIQAMIDGSDKGRPAAEAAVPFLIDRFRDVVWGVTLNKCIGKMIKTVLGRKGYFPTDKSLPMKANPIFKSGTVYAFGHGDGHRISEGALEIEESREESNPHMDGIVRNVLPGDSDATKTNTKWFRGQNSFEQQEIKHLVAYKRQVLGILEDGPYSKKPNHTYPHILPLGSQKQAFYGPLADPIIQHLMDENIQQHTEVLNLKSSQTCCLNLLFPLQQNLTLACDVLGPFLEDLEEVTGIEFEYTGQDEAKGERGCTEWLGEPPGGKRGQNRTSIDAAIFWRNSRGQRCATLVEWKYTERSFGGCSAFNDSSPADEARCLGNSRDCMLQDGGPYRSRLYWSRLEEAGIDVSRLSEIAGCPFRGPFYQLMRQYLVARYMLVAKTVDHTEVVAIHFSRNEALKAVPPELRPLGGKDVLEAWNSALKGVPPMRAIEAEQLMAAYDGVQGVDAGWREYVRQRYRI